MTDGAMEVENIKIVFNLLLTIYYNLLKSEKYNGQKIKI